MLPNQQELIVCEDSLWEAVLGAAIEVHKELGPGLLEFAYERALMIELRLRRIKARCQIEVPAFYKGEELGLGFRADVIVEDRLLLELKAVQKLDDVHLAQVITYLRLLRFKHGYLLNFNAPLMKQGIQRISI